jgi:HK97 gp10 family phage protein
VATVRIDASQVNRLAVQIVGATYVAPEIAQRAVQRTAEAVHRDAKLTVPVDTGNLRSSITRDVERTPTGAAAEVGPTAEYGGFVEYGTSRMGPQPYMGPAFTAHAHELAEALEHVADAIDGPIGAAVGRIRGGSV